MSTPAANKRRRVDAANVTLRKPFHSPVLKRPENGAGSSNTPKQTKPAAENDAYSPSSPSLVPANRSFPAPRPTSHGRPSSPLKFKTPIQRSGVKRKAPKSAESDEDHDHPGAAILALVKGHRHIAQDAMLKELDRKIEVVRQAKRIEEASEKKRPGQPVDEELRELAAKWKAASRMAAEEVFDVVRERVANSGGPKAWKEMRQRQKDFYQGWDQEETKPKKSEETEDGAELEEQFEWDDDGGGAAEEQAVQEKKEADEAEEDSEPEFNMTQMLQSLNIEPFILEYDEVEEKWID